MARRRPQHENHERWLVSYADFITLLFAFFVVMFASSEVNREKVGKIAEAYALYLEGEIAPENLAAPAPQGEPGSAQAIAGDPALAAAYAEMKPILDRANERLADLIEEGKVQLTIQGRGLVMSLKEAALFGAGQADFLPGAQELLGRVAESLDGAGGHSIRLEGHTDDTPIQTAQYPSNWELSAARAINVLDLMTGRLGLDPEQVSVAGYGEYRPAEKNDTAAGRSANRRVDIVILSRSATALEPRQDVGNQPLP